MLISFFDNKDYGYRGLINTVSSFCNVKVWDENKSIYDMMDELQPDFAIWKQSDFKHKIDTIKKEFKNTKSIILDDNFPPLAANIFNFSPVKNTEFESDVLIIGESVDNIHWISPLVSQGFKLKIIGKTPFSVPQYIGQTTSYESIQFIDNAKIVIVFNPQSELNILARGKCCICPTNQVTMFAYQILNPNNLLNAIHYFLNNPNVREEETEKIQSRILSENTYYHHAQEFFKMLKLGTLIKEIDVELDKIRLSY